jgi:hypothetical protein
MILKKAGNVAPFGIRHNNLAMGRILLAERPNCPEFADLGIGLNFAVPFEN